jgi:tetratricopeptide (TPR) repeat protein
MTPMVAHSRGRLTPTVGLWLALGLSVSMCAAARADQTNQLEIAEQAYAVGNYEQAASLARGQTSSNAALLTARALLTKAMLLDVEDPEVLALATTAKNYADLARSLSPDLVEAHLDAAIARGLKAHHLAHGEAIANVEEARLAIDHALRLAPDDPWVQATEGGWHLTLTGRLGALAANVMFGASRSEGLAAFDRAFAGAPDDAKLLYNFAKVRMLQGDGLAAEEARAAVRKLLRLSPADTLGRSFRVMGPKLLAAIDAEEAARMTHHLPD